MRRSPPVKAWIHHWLDHYDEFLAELRATGRIEACDDIADEMFLASDRCARSMVSSRPMELA